MMEFVEKHPVWTGVIVVGGIYLAGKVITGVTSSVSHATNPPASGGGGGGPVSSIVGGVFGLVGGAASGILGGFGL